MKTRQRARGRRGTIVPMLAVFITSLFAFVALAIDLGILTVARSNCQNAADAAALAGARTLDNKPTSVANNSTAAMNNAVYVVAGGSGTPGNSLLNSNFSTANISSVQVGIYDYNTTSQQFSVTNWSSSYTPSGGGSPNPGNPPVAGKSWTAMQVVVQGSQPTFFGKIFGTSTLSTSALAVAVHRPRDIAMVLDFTGSMGQSSWTSVTGTNLMNDPNSVYPAFGHNSRYLTYQTTNQSASGTGSPASSRPNPYQFTSVITSAPYVYSPANLTITTPNGPPIVQDFYYDPANLTNPTTAVPTTSQANLKNAFQSWNPSQTSAGDPNSYIGATYDYTGYNAFDTTGTSGPLPAPDNFKDQSDLAGISYVGDKFPRKSGYNPAVGTSTSWDVTTTNGAAVTLAEYLGWAPKYSSGTSLPSISSFPTGRTINNFRDATWETYGYDMDVADYIAHRGSNDPRTTLPSNTTGNVAGQVKVTPGKFKGYSMGPQYWGKTFLIWPPDPRTPALDPGLGQTPPTGYVAGDWRQRYFFNSSGNPLSKTTDNPIDPKVVRGSTGIWSSASIGTGQINYPAILKWIKSGPMVFPPNLRSGRVIYYSSIPDDVNTAVGSSDQQIDKKFWKDYIYFVLTDQGLGDFENKGWPEGVTPSVSTTALTAYLTDPVPYMNYMDNPSRPRGQGWFGPVTLLAFLNQNTSQSLWSGTSHQAQCWQLKVGVNSVISDVRNNHPNDFFGLAFFTVGSYSSHIVPSGQDYTTLSNALFFPRSILTQIPTPATANVEIRAYSTGGAVDPNGNVPNAQNNTDPNSGMCMAYNLLSPNPTASQDGVNYTTPASVANRQGRRGAAKIVVFETDGVPNSTGNWTLQKSGYNSYYQFGSAGGTTATAASDAVAVVTQICQPVATVNTTGTNSGYSLPNTPARVYAIGFGDIFSTSAGPTAASFLLSVQQAGNTSAATDTSIPASQIITGDYSTRIANLKDGLSRIFQSGVQVTLIQ